MINYDELHQKIVELVSDLLAYRLNKRGLPEETVAIKDHSVMVLEEDDGFALQTILPQGTLDWFSDAATMEITMSDTDQSITLFVGSGLVDEDDFPWRCDEYNDTDFSRQWKIEDDFSDPLTLRAEMNSELCDEILDLVKGRVNLLFDEGFSTAILPLAKCFEKSAKRAIKTVKEKEEKK